jgi:hypothetical protein
LRTEAFFAAILACVVPAPAYAKAAAQAPSSAGAAVAVEPLTVNGHATCKRPSEACYQEVLSDWIVARPDEVYQVSKWCTRRWTREAQFKTGGLSELIGGNSATAQMGAAALTAQADVMSSADRTFCNVVWPHGGDAKRRLEAIRRLSRDLKQAK